jgi:hypothetical protein
MHSHSVGNSPPLRFIGLNKTTAPIPEYWNRFQNRLNIPAARREHKPDLPTHAWNRTRGIFLGASVLFRSE